VFSSFKGYHRHSLYYKGRHLGKQTRKLGNIFQEICARLTYGIADVL
jgi:hypothetical protein